MLFNPFLESSEIASQRYPLVESALVKANGILFTHGSISEYTSLMDQFYSILDNHIGHVAAKLRVQGPEIASRLRAATFGFGNAKSFLSEAFHHQNNRRKSYVEAYQSSHGQEEPPEDPKSKYAFMQAYWASIDDARFEGTDFPQQMSGTGRQLPEDFVMRGLIWAQYYFPTEFFSGQIVDEDLRNLELPSHTAP